MSCTIEYCDHPEYAEGVCLWHYPLWETWGYSGGYEVYQTRGQEEGRKQFKKWLMQQRHQNIIDIFTEYDWKLTQAVNESIASDTKRIDTPEDTSRTGV